jgi:Type III secretion system, cytoplasmic E component of needle
VIPWLGKEPPTEDSPISAPFDFGMTDLEEQLRAAGGERKRAEVIDRFSALDHQIASVMLSGIPPEEFQRGRILREAIAHAQKIIVAFR